MSINENPNILSDYDLIETLGAGTFSEVKLGINKITKEKVAIKMLDKDKINNENDLTRLKREIHMLRTFSHINIIKTYEIAENDVNFLIIMEYCKHGELFNQIIEKKKLTEKEASYYYYQLINGLEYIHSNGIVHRDLKPENLLISKGNILKIIDFGLSNFFNGENLLKTPCGSPCYASPEMVSGKKYNGFYIDIWSTGIILYAMLCGFLPFEDNNNVILFQKIQECNFTIPNYVSKICKNLIKSIVVKDPNKRIKISEIKRHPFYLKGKEYFKKIHPELFMEEIIIPNDIGAGHYTERGTNSDLKDSSNKTSQEKIRFKRKNMFKRPITLKINIDINKMRKNNLPYENHTSDNKNINKDSILRDLEKFIHSHYNKDLSQNQTFNMKINNTINTKSNSNNFTSSNQGNFENYNSKEETDNKRDFSNESAIGKNKKRIYTEQNALKKHQYLELSANKENSKYRPITSIRGKSTNISNIDNRNDNINNNRYPTNFELYGIDVKKKIKKNNPYNCVNKYNSAQFKYIDKLSNIHSMSNNQNSVNLSEKYTSTSIYAIENSFNKKAKNNINKTKNNPIIIKNNVKNNIFYPLCNRNYNKNITFNNPIIYPYQSITTKKINDLYQARKSPVIHYRNKKAMYKNDFSNSHDVRIERPKKQSKKKIDKNKLINFKNNQMNEKGKKGKNFDNIIKRKLNENILKNKENPIYLYTENIPSKSKRKQNTQLFDKPFIKLENLNINKKMNSALLSSCKFDPKIEDLTYSSKNSKNKIQNIRKSKI